MQYKCIIKHKIVGGGGNYSKKEMMIGLIWSEKMDSTKTPPPAAPNTELSMNNELIYQTSTPNPLTQVILLR